MKKLLLFITVFFASVFTAYSQIVENYRSLDKTYDFNACPSASAVPEGYKPFYVSHYGRHGSRYAYSGIFYDVPHLLFSTALKEDNLTDFGKDVAERFEKAYPELFVNKGLLSDKGREQQKRLGRRMYKHFPEAFPGGARIYAVSSGSMRSVISMASFCVGLAGCDSTLNIRLEQSPEQLSCTAPRDKNNSRNINRVPAPELPEQMKTDIFDYFGRSIDCNAILSRMFKDSDKALKTLEDLERSESFKKGKNLEANTVWILWIFSAGMASIDNGPNFDDMFTAGEWKAIWEADCFLHFREYYKYLDDCCQVVEDILEDCRSHVKSGECGAKLRFGHDHVLLPLLTLLKIDDFACIPQSPAETYKTYPTWRSPMAGNIQIVLYRKESPRNKKASDVLIRILLNEEDVKLCSWAEFEELCNGVLEAFPIKK